MHESPLLDSLRLKLIDGSHSNGPVHTYGTGSMNLRLHYVLRLADDSFSQNARINETLLAVPRKSALRQTRQNSREDIRPCPALRLLRIARRIFAYSIEHDSRPNRQLQPRHHQRTH